MLVRKEIWDIREDRQALKKFLEDEAALDKELTPDAKAKLVGHPTKFLNDAEYHEALCRLGARLKRLALEKPEEVRSYMKE